MRWTAKDISMYFQSKEYIDTALIPIIPIAFDETGKEAANGSEFIQLIALEIERQFKGRILLLPAFVHFLNEAESEKQKLLKRWFLELSKENFHYQFFISSDLSLKPVIEKLGGELIWLPSIPMEHLDESNKSMIIDQQAKQLLSFFVEKWQRVEKGQN